MRLREELSGSEGSTTLDQLYPVAVRVVHESQASHFSLLGLFLEGITFAFKLLTRGGQVIDQKTDVSKAARVCVPAVIGKFIIFLSAVIVGQF